MKKIGFLLVLVVWSFAAMAQDVILTMSGREIQCAITDDSGFEIVYNYENARGKTKEGRVHKSEVFSVSQGSQPEQIYYSQDTLLGDWMNEAEMRIYLAGQVDARAHYDVRNTFALGLGGARFVSYIAGGGLILSIAFPVLYTVYQLIPYIKIREETISNPIHRYNEIYALGYERVARTKQVLNALAGSAIGMLGGIVYYLLGPFD
ncbi:MAG: hypothetical protein KDC12_11205 [Flavobacteriales bacterium]|nr:hypothetical protein [Flavobacteriales bacterium]